ncbi:unnamed protein product [Didymodactylos carnosus]|uniref:Filamin n=1 Tax=Didymodactylos carnosus TaxID=1234261 RepID=A0A814A802_9BILA|nr:unnamed protein product [Didymodactylos carnosus]CAF3692006.1 unnamed protein product [Didymodactylos carnosus]
MVKESRRELFSLQKSYRRLATNPSPDDFSNVKHETNNENIPVPGSPFRISTISGCDPTRVRAYGPAQRQTKPQRLQLEQIALVWESKVQVLMLKCLKRTNVQQEILIDGQAAGPGTPAIDITDVHGRHKPAHIRSRGEGIYVAEFTSASEGQHRVDISWSDNPIPWGPYNVQILPHFEPRKVIVDGPGIRSGVPASLPNNFRIDTREADPGINPHIQVGEVYTITVYTHKAGPGAVMCRIRSTHGNDLDIDIVDNQDGIFNIFYTAHNPGNYTIKIKFGGQNIPGGDRMVTVSVLI